MHRSRLRAPRSNTKWMLTSLAFAALGFMVAPDASAADTPFDIRDDVLIRTADGATLSATVVRPRASQKLPTLLTMTIYTRPEEAIVRGKNIAERGFVSVLADVRGKRLSPDRIDPYEHDGADAYAVIDWIVKQPWSDGQVGMWGGSYNGFTAWAATKRRHPALKTIAVSAAAIPGLGLPMHNNVFLNANYGWAFYVTNNKTLDEATYNQNERWRKTQFDWFASGRPYRDFDRIDGTPNPFFQRWISHPEYDGYWQAMVPYGKDFSRIDIPVLTITGYYDDGQISALHYLKQHYAHNTRAEHYLVIGPYDHFGTHAAAKAKNLRGYAIDASAQFSTPALTLDWMDHVLRGGQKPAMLADRINYEVMGANAWRHVDSLQTLAERSRRWYFAATKNGERHDLVTSKPTERGSVEHLVDFKNRNLFHNFHSYPMPIVQERLEYITETLYVTAPFERSTIVSGPFRGELGITINKRDVDLGVTVYEEAGDGKLFHLGYWLGRASYARDASKRTLLTPGATARIPFETQFVSRQLASGSRLLFLLDVNKNPSAQVNYGTGKDVSDESIADAGEPLRIEWLNDSFVDVPIDR